MISQRLQPISPIAQDVYEGLSRTPKSLPPRLFYDHEGSELFEEITRLPEYYLTRTEQQILDEHAREMVEHAGCPGESSSPDTRSPNLFSRPLRKTGGHGALAGEVEGADGAGLTVIELGAGTASKTRTILRALQERQHCVEFYPVDVSPSPLELARERLQAEFPRLTVRPIVGDYTHGLPQLGTIPGRKLILYIGSSIGNFEPMEAAAVLARIRHALAPGDSLLLGADLAKDKNVLIPAYDDAAGVTARFNKNVLARINRELGGHFDVDSFRHVAEWNRCESRMEMYLESTVAQTVAVRDIALRVRFAAGERIHTENSYKFTQPMITSILSNAGFSLERTWTDERKWFALHLAQVAEA